jgi:Bacteriocin-protection, YdeI or OmpD-Associated
MGDDAAGPWSRTFTAPVGSARQDEVGERDTCNAPRSTVPSGSSGEYSHDRYRGPVSSQRVPGGVVHKLPGDLRKALIANPTALDAWNDITPLARNEFICWVEDAKQETTRERRISRTQEELEDGQRRPCCWPGCKHRERTGA